MCLQHHFWSSNMRASTPTFVWIMLPLLLLGQQQQVEAFAGISSAKNGWLTRLASLKDTNDDWEGQPSDPYGPEKHFTPFWDAHLLTMDLTTLLTFGAEEQTKALLLTEGDQMMYETENDDYSALEEAMYSEANYRPPMEEEDSQAPSYTLWQGTARTQQPLDSSAAADNGREEEPRRLVSRFTGGIEKMEQAGHLDHSIHLQQGGSQRKQAPAGNQYSTGGNNNLVSRMTFGAEQMEQKGYLDHSIRVGNGSRSNDRAAVASSSQPRHETSNPLVSRMYGGGEGLDKSLIDHSVYLDRSGREHSDSNGEEYTDLVSSNTPEDISLDQNYWDHTVAPETIGDKFTSRYETWRSGPMTSASSNLVSRMYGGSEGLDKELIDHNTYVGGNNPFSSGEAAGRLVNRQAARLRRDEVPPTSRAMDFGLPAMEEKGHMDYSSVPPGEKLDKGSRNSKSGGMSQTEVEHLVKLNTGGNATMEGTFNDDLNYSKVQPEDDNGSRKRTLPTMHGPERGGLGAQASMGTNDLNSGSQFNSRYSSWRTPARKPGNHLVSRTYGGGEGIDKSLIDHNIYLDGTSGRVESDGTLEQERGLRPPPNAGRFADLVSLNTGGDTALDQSQIDHSLHVPKKGRAAKLEAGAARQAQGPSRRAETSVGEDNLHEDLLDDQNIQVQNYSKSTKPSSGDTATPSHLVSMIHGDPEGFDKSVIDHSTYLDGNRQQRDDDNEGSGQTSTGAGYYDKGLVSRMYGGTEGLDKSLIDENNYVRLSKSSSSKRPSKRISSSPSTLKSMLNSGAETMDKSRVDEGVYLDAPPPSPRKAPQSNAASPSTPPTVSYYNTIFSFEDDQPQKSPNVERTDSFEDDLYPEEDDSWWV